MRHRKNILVLGAVLCISIEIYAAIKPLETIEINKKVKIVHYELSNGLQIFLTNNKNAANVTVSHWVKAGSLHEKKGTTGIAHLFEHMMFRPLATGKPSFFDIVSKLGGQLNASTRFESTYYYSTVPTENLDSLLQAESDRFKHLKVSDELLNIERKAVWSEYSTKFDSSPVIESWFNIYNKAFPNHPFEWMIIGFREDLEKINASDCNEFFSKYYLPNNTGIFVTGNFDESSAIASIEKYYSDWKKGEQSNLPESFSSPTKLTIVEGKLDSQAKLILAGFRVPMLNKENAELQTLANYILFSERNGLLKKNLVNQLRLASEVSSFNFSYDNGMLKTSIVVLPGVKVTDIQKQILALPQQFDDMSEDQFNAYKMNLYISFNEGIEKKNELADMSSLMWGKYSDIRLLKKLTNGPSMISKSAMKEFINKYVREENLVIAFAKGLPR